MSTPLTVDFGEERTRFKKKTRFLDGVTPRGKNEGVLNAREMSACVEFDEDSKYVGPVTKSNGKKKKKKNLPKKINFFLYNLVKSHYAYIISFVK